MEQTFPKKTAGMKSPHHILKEELESADPRCLGADFFNSVFSPRLREAGGKRRVARCQEGGMGKISGSVPAASCEHSATACDPSITNML